MTIPTPHGNSPARGCAHLGLGEFSSLLDLAPADFDDTLLRKLGGKGGLMDDAKDSSDDNSAPAGYTFFAQFVDHDITLDTGSKLDKRGQQPDELKNLRSASLDLDCVYGFGPDANPHLYRTGGELLTGTDKNKDDLARNSEGRALIGDPRNDENLFVSQMQLAFIRLHNRFYKHTKGDFEKAQEMTRHHYQWVVWNDLLKRVCDPKVYAFAEACRKKGQFPLIYAPDEHGKLDMPVEFSVGAYRFGHSMVRSVYAANSKYQKVELFDECFSTLGFKPVPRKLVVDWSYLLDGYRSKHYRNGKGIDHHIASELIRLPIPNIVGKGDMGDKQSLPFRNLLRGRSLGLPSGQATGRALYDRGYADAGLPYAAWQQSAFDKLKGWSNCKLNKADLRQLAYSAPLFFYVLAEGALCHRGKHLGPVGSALLLEVFGGILDHCGTSYWHGKPFKPCPAVKIANKKAGLTLGDLVRYAERY